MRCGSTADPIIPAHAAESGGLDTRPGVATMLRGVAEPAPLTSPAPQATNVTVGDLTCAEPKTILQSQIEQKIAGRFLRVTNEPPTVAQQRFFQM